MKNLTMTGMLLGAILLATGSAHAAPGMVLDAKHLPAQTAADLRAQIGKQRLSDDKAFRSVHDIAARSKALDAKARGGKAPIALYLKALGTPAVLPLVEMLAFEAPADVPVDVRRDLVEALGMLRDHRAMPVLGAMLEREADPHLARAAAEAVARMESDESSQRLVSALASAQGERRAAILAGMGASHRAATIRAVAAKLGEAGLDEASARAAIKSLGRAGNAWIWPTLPQKNEGPEARSVAAKALVAAYVAHDGELRQESSDALMMVDDPSTPTLIADAKRTASPALASALDALATRFANNPARTK